MYPHESISRNGRKSFTIVQKNLVRLTLMKSSQQNIWRGDQKEERIKARETPDADVILCHNRV